MEVAHDAQVYSEPKNTYLDAVKSGHKVRVADKVPEKKTRIQEVPSDQERRFS